MDGILGTAGSDARLASDLTLLAYIVLLVPAMLVGFVFARRKMFRPYHKMTMTTITVVNWVIILFLMAVSYSKWVAPFLQFGVSESVRLLPTLHLITGGLAQLTATWLVIMMWTEKTRFEGLLPKALRTRNIKPFMRATLALWLVTAALGVITFLTWYPPSGAAAGPAPVATEEPSVTPEMTPDAIETPAGTPEVAATEPPPAATDDAAPAETPES